MKRNPRNQNRDCASRPERHSLVRRIVSRFMMKFEVILIAVLYGLSWVFAFVAVYRFYWS
jgi:hypothetical protein